MIFFFSVGESRYLRAVVFFLLSFSYAEAMAEIDWHSFVVVATITFDDEGKFFLHFAPVVRFIIVLTPILATFFSLFPVCVDFFVEDDYLPAPKTTIEEMNAAFQQQAVLDQNLGVGGAGRVTDEVSVSLLHVLASACVQQLSNECVVYLFYVAT